MALEAVYEMSKVFYRGAAATSSATLYTVPTNATSKIKSIIVGNAAAIAGTFTLSFDGFVLFPAVAISANSAFIIDIIEGQVLGSAKLLAGFASAVTITFSITGTETV